MNKEAAILKLKKRMASDDSLPFYGTANNLVFGEGSLDPKVYFLGEAPGKNEDKFGRPFVGRSGRLLRSLIIKSGLKENEVYITSVVRYRPPKNRTPKLKEVLAYEKYVNAELEIIKPELIVPIGAVSLKKFSKQSITQIHGKVLDTEWYGRKLKIFPLFHPAAALRNPAIKRMLEKDFRKLQKFTVAKKRRQ